MVLFLMYVTLYVYIILKVSSPVRVLGISRGLLRELQSRLSGFRWLILAGLTLKK